jgi:hypothetical protein
MFFFNLIVLSTVFAADHPKNISQHCTQSVKKCDLLDSHCNKLNGTDKNDCRCVVIPKSIKCIDLSSSCSSKEKLELTSIMKPLLLKCQKSANATAPSQDVYPELPKFRVSSHPVSPSKNLTDPENNASVPDTSLLLFNVLMMFIGF